ncbi:MAG: FecR family protein [Agriterribacter sp.]
MTGEEAIAILRRYRNGTCSDEDAKIIEQWYAALEAEGMAEWSDDEKPGFSRDVFERIQAEIIKEQQANSPVVNVKKNIWWKVAAAAAIIVGIGSFAWLKYGSNEDRKITKFPGNTIPHRYDAEPGKNGAVLTLANGMKIVLDTASGGIINVPGEPQIFNKDGTLTYNGDNSSHITAYNSIVTPKGRQYKLILADGTRVWLNAASSLHYPVVFNKKPRNIEVSGEAYFEVAESLDEKGNKIPFIVKILHEKGEPSEVQVLGTHFNINAYDDEPDTKVTLLEGAVRVHNALNKPVQIKPGQQAKIGEKISVDEHADIDLVMAWKNGVFNFKNVDIGTVMRQAERWYDIRVSYPLGIPSDTLNGGISRDVQLSEFLDIIRYSDINATIRDGVVDIQPASAGKK